LVFCLLWAELVFRNIAHTTVCGVAATDFFVPEGVPNPVWGAFCRTCTYSLGSICFGSVILAVVQFVRVIANSLKNEAARKKNPVLMLIACCIEFFLSCVEAMIEYFNRYAFVQVAMYGKGFIQAAKDTWSLVKTAGVDAVINDLIISKATGMCTFLSAVFIGLMTGLVSFGVAHGNWWTACDEHDLLVASLIYASIAGLVAFIITALIHGLVFGILDSAVVAFFVCFVEEPEVLALKHPELSAQINAYIAGPSQSDSV
jgi:hypothetical protein